MNKRALIVIAVVAVLVVASMAVALVYLNKGSANSEITGNISIVDDRGKTVNMTEAPKRIVSLGSAFTEIIFDLDTKSKVVGVDSSSMWLVENASMTSSIANLGAVSSLSVESVMAQNPDLVVVWNFNMYSTFITNLENANITVAAFYPKNVTTILHTIDVLGEGIGEKAKAQDMVTSMQARIDAVTSKTANLTNDQRPKVYLELMSKGGQTVGNGTMSNDLINMAGGLNIFANSTTSNFLAQKEDIIGKNPDIIIIENQSSKTNQQLKDAIGPSVTAVSGDKIYRIDGTTLTTSPRVVDALEQMYAWFHPEPSS
jgi:cobalamin transport system substrate-binding protein